MDGFNISGGNANTELDNSGGGMTSGGAPVLTNIIFTNNSAIYGGGLSNVESSPTLINVTFSDNSATYGGGMYTWLYYGGANLTDVTFSNNSATFGGGMYNYDHYYHYQPIILTRVTFTNNSATSGGGLYNDSASPTLTNVLFSGNTAENGGGMYNGFTYGGTLPVLTTVVFANNLAANAGGGMYNSSSSPTLNSVSFISNEAAGVGGGGMYNDASSPTLINSLFVGNIGASFGGGIYNGNASSSTLTNVTFSMNSADNAGGGIFNTDSSLSLVNSILWGDAPDEVYNSNSSIIITYSDVQGGYEGAGNIDTDPLFVDAANSNLHLQRISPAIDAGDNTAPGLAGITTDLNGNLRFYDVPWILDSGNGTPPIVDMGAYEHQPIVRYVDMDATGNNDGTSWQDAYSDLNPALEAVISGEQIWVAAGTYYPSVEYCGTGDDRYKSFQLKNKVALYGGFDPSIGDIGWNDRNWVENVTILSGDIGIQGDNSDNSYHVFCHPNGLNLENNAILDGFTVTGGNADGAGIHAYGGGMYNSSASPTLLNTTFSYNSAHEGGGIYNDSSSPALANDLFVKNSAIYGGGIYNANASNPVLTNVTSLYNIATYGGGIYNLSSTPILVNAILWGDTPNEVINENSSALITYSDIQGGYSGVGNIDVDPLFIDSTNGDFRLKSNSPAIDAGDNAAPGLEGIAIDLDGKGRFVDVPWVVDSGNGIPPIVDMGAYEYHLTIFVDVEASGNNNGTSWNDAYIELQPALAQAVMGDQIWVAAGTYLPTVTYCGSEDRNKSFQLKNGVAVYGGFDPSVGDTTLESRNWAKHVTILSGEPGGWGVEDNSYHVFCHPMGLNLNSSAVLDGFTITGGNGTHGPWGNELYYDGAGMFNDFSSPTLINVHFSGNVGGNGGGMYNYYSSPRMTNVTFSGNSANFTWLSGGGGYGGGIYNSFSSPTLTNVTFSGNSAEGDLIFDGSGGGMANSNSFPSLTNVTFYGNKTGGSGGGMINSNSFPTLTNCILWGNLPDQIAGDPAIVTYSDIQGGYEGIGNIDADPKILEAGPWVWNLHLYLDSPAIDAGNNVAQGLIGIATDLDGKPRFVDIPWIIDTGNGSAPMVDMGAYEAQIILPIFLPVISR
jgi:predicted outer membrane repeat protein